MLCSIWVGLGFKLGLILHKERSANSADTSPVGQRILGMVFRDCFGKPKSVAMPSKMAALACRFDIPKCLHVQGSKLRDRKLPNHFLHHTPNVAFTNRET